MSLLLSEGFLGGVGQPPAPTRTSPRVLWPVLLLQEVPVGSAPVSSPPPPRPASLRLV